ncbi:MAG TPA: hypothetical protein VKR56_16275 [Candidatus Cybelea sp.]|nr:hypothetical protein [Candidatus Cybelea sp.]
MRPLRALAMLALVASLGASSSHLDSQYVLAQYALAIKAVSAPKVVVFSYTVSQVGPSNIEQHHRIYRSGLDVRDDTLSVDGITLLRKVARISRYEDRYAIARFSPSTASYELLFLGTVKDGRHFDYVYEATPLNRSSGTWIDRLTIDGANFLPRVVRFHSAGAGVEGSGEVEFGPFGKYWMPEVADAGAQVGGKPARERIAWSDYRFPQSLPPSTFQAPQPLPHSSLPTI